MTLAQDSMTPDRHADDVPFRPAKPIIEHMYGSDDGDDASPAWERPSRFARVLADQGAPAKPRGRVGVAPPGWPQVVRPPGVEGWEATAVTWLFDLCPPGYRGHDLLRGYPVVLARMARQHVSAALAAARHGYGTAREELAPVVPAALDPRAALGVHDLDVAALVPATAVEDLDGAVLAVLALDQGFTIRSYRGCPTCSHGMSTMPLPFPRLEILARPAHAEAVLTMRGHPSEGSAVETREVWCVAGEPESVDAGRLDGAGPVRRWSATPVWAPARHPGATGTSSHAAATPKPWLSSPARYSSSPGT